MRRPDCSTKARPLVWIYAPRCRGIFDGDNRAEGFEEYALINCPDGSSETGSTRVGVIDWLCSRFEKCVSGHWMQCYAEQGKADAMQRWPGNWSAWGEVRPRRGTTYDAWNRPADGRFSLSLWSSHLYCGDVDSFQTNKRRKGHSPLEVSYNG